MARGVILFDDDCGFCRWSLARILAWDRRGRLRPVALRDPEADHLLRAMSPDRKMASWHLIGPGGRIWSGGDAVAPLARLLPFGAPIAALAGALPRTTRKAYAWVAAHRDRFGEMLGEQACTLPPSALARTERRRER